MQKLNIDMNTEIEIVNRPEIPSSILLTENVKELIKDLIIEDNEQFERKKYYYESLLRIWLGENWIGNNLSGNLNELLGPSNTFTKCQKYIKELISENLPGGETEIYNAYYSVLDKGQCEVRNGEEIIVYTRDVFDMKTFCNYIKNLNIKIDRQYEHLLAEFKSFVLDLLKDLDKGNISSAIAHLSSGNIVSRESSNRKPQPIERLSPSFAVKFGKSKTKKTLPDFLRVNVEARKKAMVNNKTYLTRIFS